MNARRKSYLRSRQRWQRMRDEQERNKGEPSITDCQRCGKPFMPKWNRACGCWGKCCDTCGARNLFDGLDLPTPPALLDKFTRHPTLTDAEWITKL